MATNANNARDFDLNQHWPGSARLRRHPAAASKYQARTQGNAQPKQSTTNDKQDDDKT